MSEVISRRRALKILGLGAAALVTGTFSSACEPIQSNEPLGPTVNKVSFKKDGIIEVNQKPIFPLGLYYLPGQESLETWQKMGKAGFNLINQWWINPQTLASAEQNNIYTMACLPYTFPNIDKTGVDPKIVQQLRSSKSFLGYYGADEPDITLTRNLYTTSLEKLEHLDPDHPDLTVFAEAPNLPENFPFDTKTARSNYKGDPGDISELPNDISVNDFDKWYIEKSGTEIVSFDYYDKTDYVGTGDVTRRYIKSLRTGRYGGDAKAVWVTLSAHSDISRTLKEMRYQAINVIANGATGLLWWDWPSGCNSKNCSGYVDGNPNGYSTHWDKLLSISKELNLVKDGLIGQEVSLGQTEPNGAISYKVTTDANGKFFIFSASNMNADDGSISQNMSGLPKETRFNVVGENRTLTTDSKGVLTDNFEYLGAQIYVQT